MKVQVRVRTRSGKVILRYTYHGIGEYINNYEQQLSFCFVKFGKNLVPLVVVERDCIGAIFGVKKI